jgi:hypothetical protein
VAVYSLSLKLTIYLESPHEVTICWIHLEIMCSGSGNCFSAGCLNQGFTSKPTRVSSWISSMDALSRGHMCNVGELYFESTSVGGCILCS